MPFSALSKNAVSSTLLTTNYKQMRCFIEQFCTGIFLALNGVPLTSCQHYNYSTITIIPDINDFVFGFAVKYIIAVFSFFFKDSK